MKSKEIMAFFCLLSMIFFSCGYEDLDALPDQEYEPDCLCEQPKQKSADHFWFVQISDIEQTRLSGSEIASFAIPERGDYDTFLRQLRYIYDVVSPQFVVATGDLVYGGILSQVPEQWEDYRMAVSGSCFDQSNYHDLPGNHDVMFTDDFELYEAKSISGKTHDSWSYENLDGRYAFVSFNTSRPNKVDGYFGQEEKDRLGESLEEYMDFDVRIAFAHHSTPGPHMGELFGPEGVLATYDVQGFFGGHIHKDSESRHDGTLVFQTDTTYVKDGSTTGGRFRIVSFDRGSFATSSKWILNHGPQVLISYPQDADMANSANPEGHIVEGPTPIRALAFSESEVRLSVYIGDDGPYLMEALDDFRHETEIDFGAYESGRNEIYVVAEGGEAGDDNPRDSIEVSVP